MRDYLKKLRECSNLTQEEAAEKLCLSRAYYSRVENGERKKSLDLSLAIKISKLFNVSVDYIIAEEEKLKAAEVV